jgi:8-oxo-dGTP pyrophosphatase MutT (NUDIX family)
MECANCGCIGHTFRDCAEPVTSYGIIGVKLIEGIPQYLLICRRDSISYVEFMRGKYRLHDSAYIATLIDGMTIDERARMLKHDFDALWEALWASQNTRQYRNEYNSAKLIFNTLKERGDISGKLLSRYIEMATTSWTTPEWGFPKGRRVVHESRADCALREFSEETGMSSRVLHVLRDRAPLEETYVGSNGVPYRQYYFLGSIASHNIAQVQPHNRVMNREVGGIAWMTFEAAHAAIRPTNAVKRALLAQLNERILGDEDGLRSSLLAALEWNDARA